MIAISKILIELQISIIAVCFLLLRLASSSNFTKFEFDVQLAIQSSFCKISTFILALFTVISALFISILD